MCYFCNVLQYSGEVWQGKSLLNLANHPWFAKLKPSNCRLVLPINNLLAILWYNSKATWYPNVCCSLKILGWRLHHAFNNWTGTRFIRTHIREIVRCVYTRTLHSFWINFVLKLNIDYIYIMNLRILSLYVPIDPWIDCPTEKLLRCSCVQYFIPYCLVCQSGSFIGEWISINLFVFGLLVSWKPVRKYASY